MALKFLKEFFKISTLVDLVIEVVGALAFIYLFDLILKLFRRETEASFGYTVFLVLTYCVSRQYAKFRDKNEEK